MSAIKLREDIEIIMDNCGMITFYKDGKTCFVHIHPVDTTKLVSFLVKSGYNFTLNNED